MNLGTQSHTIRLDAPCIERFRLWYVGQAGGVRQVADYVSKLRRVGKGLGVYEFDKEIGDVADKMGGGDPALPASA